MSRLGLGGLLIGVLLLGSALKAENAGIGGNRGTDGKFT